MSTTTFVLGELACIAANVPGMLMGHWHSWAAALGIAGFLLIGLLVTYV